MPTINIASVDVLTDVAAGLSAADRIRIRAEPRANGSQDLIVPGDLALTIKALVADPATGRRARLSAYAASTRWKREVGGCVLDGHPVATDRDSQSKLIAEMVAIGAGLRQSPSFWKFADGSFANLTNEQMIEVIGAARSHVAGVFATEAAVLAGIANDSITSIGQIDSAFSQ